MLETLGNLLIIIGFLSLPVIIIAAFFIPLYIFALLLAIDSVCISTGNLLARSCKREQS